VTSMARWVTGGVYLQDMSYKLDVGTDPFSQQRICSDTLQVNVDSSLSQ
jgi:hypothetical protein